MTHQHIAIIGGGAAGFFAAITAAEADPTARVTIYEKGNDFLSKVRISGGGRCNVTHACFDAAPSRKTIRAAPASCAARSTAGNRRTPSHGSPGAEWS